MKEESLLLESLRELLPVPTPAGVNSRELVRRAIEFLDPPRLPYSFYFNPSATDMVIIGPLNLATPRQRGRVGESYLDQWGVTWERTGRWWDQAVGHPLADLSKLDGYRFPDVTRGIRQIRWFASLARRAGKYIVGHNTVNLYALMRSLMGFEELMMAPYTQGKNLQRLLERLTELTIQVVQVYGELGLVDGFMTCEDWGLQTSLQMKIDTFREFYRPYYQRIIDACHQHGMHFIWHNCGYIMDLFPEMIEMGVDVVQLDQPRLMGHQKLIEILGGEICMWNTVDIQWCTSSGISDEDIRREVSEMLEIYDVKKHRGGFIAKHYPQPWDIELSPMRQRMIARLFMENA